MDNPMGLVNDNIGMQALTAMWTLTILSILVVATRCYTQHFISRQLGLSDALVILAVLLLIINVGLIHVSYHYGWGRHQLFLTVKNMNLANKYTILNAGFGIMSSTLGRMSLIVLLMKLFGNHVWRRRALWALFTLQMVANSIVTLTLYVQCPNIASQWNPAIISQCWSHNVELYIGYVHTGFNAGTDFFLTVLPGYMLWNLQMKLRDKLGLAFLLCLSLLACVAVIMKMVYLRAIGHHGDFLYNTIPFFIWIVVECATVIVASSAALLRPLVRRIRPSTQTQSSNGYRLDSYGKYGKGSEILSSTTGTRNRIFSTDTIRGDSEDGIVKQVTFTVDRDIESEAASIQNTEDISAHERKS